MANTIKNEKIDVFMLTTRSVPKIQKLKQKGASLLFKNEVEKNE